MSRENELKKRLEEYQENGDTLKTFDVLFCDCISWARDGSEYLHSEHHVNCPNRNIEQEAKQHLKNILKALEYEASQGDGFNEDYYQAYEDAKFFVCGSINEVLNTDKGIVKPSKGAVPECSVGIS